MLLLLLLPLQVRPSHAGPTMQTETEAALRYKSNDVMHRKRAAHAHIIDKERSKRQRLAEQQQQQQKLAAAAAAVGRSSDRSRKQFVLPELDADGPLATGRFKDEGLFVSHTR